MASPRIEFFADKNNQWRWRAVAGNNKIVCTSAESYHNITDCEDGLVLFVSLIRLNHADVVHIGEDGGKSFGSLHALVAVSVARNQAQ